LGSARSGKPGLGLIRVGLLPSGHRRRVLLITPMGEMLPTQLANAVGR